MRIVLHEYPRSGGSWVVSLLADALGLPKRDIYVAEGFDAFDLRAHPWYREASSLELPEACVVKSHERPGSSLLGFPARAVHLVRDGRDVVTSRYFFERDFSVANGLSTGFDQSFDHYLASIAAEWSDYVTAWQETGIPTLRYEDFVRDTRGALAAALDDLALTADHAQLRRAVEANSKGRFARSFDAVFRHNTFVRKGVIGDWRSHFGPVNVAAFKAAAGAALVRLGYEAGPDWSLEASAAARS